jgi:hypothetical protein
MESYSLVNIKNILGGDAVIDIKNQWTKNALLIMKYA